MEIFAWCIMTNHVHLIFRANQKDPSAVIKSLKTYTSNKLSHLIQFNPEESRKDYFLKLMIRAANKKSNVRHLQLWQHENKPIELWTQAVIEQKLEYIHLNPVKAGFVEQPEFWRYSSAIDFAGGKGLISLSEL